MIKNKDIINYIRTLAPEYLAHSWDNVGTLVGDEQSEAANVLTALELTEEVLEEAVSLGVSLIVTHHPVIFKPMSRINRDTVQGRKIIKAIKNDITVYSAHTNLDETNGGTNDALFDVLGLTKREFLCPSSHEGYGMGRVGETAKEMTLKEFVLYVKEKLSLDSVVFSGDGSKIVKKVGLCTGASSDKVYIQGAIDKGCDVYITGDVRHHDALDALEDGMPVIDATHFATETIISGVLKNYIEKCLEKDNITNINVYESKAIKRPFNYL